MGAKGPCGHLATEDTRLPTQRRSPSEAIREVRVTLHFHQDAQDKNSEAPQTPWGAEKLGASPELVEPDEAAATADGLVTSSSEPGSRPAVQVSPASPVERPP